MQFLDRVAHRLRRRQPITVVSGLPRSGTSMAMKMLVAGGFPALVDDTRQADVDNPLGYFEFDRVKGLEHHRDCSWLPSARGKAVKIVSFLLTWLPDTYDYRVIFMHRNLAEIVASQRTMLARSGGAPAIDDREASRLAAVYGEHLTQVHRFLSVRPSFETLDMEYRQVIQQPVEQARRIAAFVRYPMDIVSMERAVQSTLYRNRR